MLLFIVFRKFEKDYSDTPCGVDNERAQAFCSCDYEACVHRRLRCASNNKLLYLSESRLN